MRVEPICTLKKSAYCSLFLLSILTLSSCTNFDLDPLTKRVNDNFSGKLNSPGDIDPAGANQFSFVVMADTHIGNPGGEVMKSMLDRVQAHGDAFVLVAGDLTDTGQEGQFLTFLTVFGNAGIPFRAAIGNHDIFFGGWKHYSRHLGRSIYSFNADNVHVAVIDTANGTIGEKQLRWLENDLRAATQEHKIVMAHFPPWNGNVSSLFKLASEEEAAVLKTILYETGVDIMFGGHYHGYNETIIGGVKYIVTGGANDLIDPGNKQHFFRVHVNGSNLRTEFVPFN